MKRTGMLPAQSLISLFVAVAAVPLAAQSTPSKKPNRFVPAPQAVVEPVSWTAGVPYSYDGGGNIIEIGNDEFIYDDVGRLVQAEVNAARRKYEYDAFGNRQKCSHEVTGVPGFSDCQYAITIDSDKNRINQATYDAGGAGNVVAFGPNSYSYDVVNMITRANNKGAASDFIYTADDERIAVYQPGSGAWDWTLRDTQNKVLREYTSQDGTAGVGKSNWTWKKDYVWRDSKLLASRQPELDKTTTYHYHLDHLGTPRRITDQKDLTVGFHDYYAFGPEVSGGLHEASRTDLKYTGHERDTLGGQYSLDYMHARYYNHTLGRFLSVDPLLTVKEALSDPQVWNRYAYALNRPIDATDPDGREVEATFYMKSGVLVVRDLQTGERLRLIGVFSGNGPYANDPASAGVKNSGPVPPGKYLIGRAYKHTPGSPGGNNTWFRLFGDNGRGGYSYENPGTLVVLPDGSKVYRDVMNLHTGSASDGCLTVPSDVQRGDQGYPNSQQYNALMKLLKATAPMIYNNDKLSGRLTVSPGKEPEPSLWDKLMSIFD